MYLWLKSARRTPDRCTSLVDRKSCNNEQPDTKQHALHAVVKCLDYSVMCTHISHTSTLKERPLSVSTSEIIHITSRAARAATHRAAGMND